MSTSRKQIVFPDGATKPIAPYSPGVNFGNLLFTSGQVGFAPGSSVVVSGGISAETRQTLENLKSVLEAGGSSLEEVLKVTVFLKRLEDYGAMNDVYKEFFPENPPARSAFAVANLPAQASVEIEAIATAI